MAVGLPESKTRPLCDPSAVAFGRVLALLLLASLFAAPVSCEPRLVTYRPQDARSTNTDGKFVFPTEETELIIFGTDLSNDTRVVLSSHPDACDIGVFIGASPIRLANNATANTDSQPVQRASLTVDFSSVSSEETLYFCLEVEGVGRHQGADPWLALVVKPDFLPIWAEIIFIIVLMMLSGLFSGLNLGLMALDPTTLKIITESGSKRQRTYAKLIYRVRRHGNYLLCTLLLGNVLVNSTLTILLDEVLPSGIYAVVASTLAIVIFGEIIPQAICSRHGLVVGAWTIPLTIIFMVLTFPLSMPLSLILNLVLGKEIGSVYNRDQLLKLLHVTKEHHDLENDEVDVISGVLNYKKKLAKDVMTNFEDIFCISIDSVLDFKTMGEIYNSGFSRIPIYEDTKENIIHLLYVRDLAFVDADDKTTLASHIQFYRHELLFFYEDTPLDEILKGFLEGKCHMGVVQAIKDVPDKDPVYVAVGVITLEDIVEEILQREIVDETDRFIDNRTFKPRQSHRTIDVNELTEGITNSLTAQQRLAVYQFLTSEVEPFSSEHMSITVLKRLLVQKSLVQKISFEDYKRKNRTIYSAGSPANFFCLVLEGCVQVVIGKEGLKFESRSFSYFGAQAMVNARQMPPPDYKPDFTARPLSDCLLVVISQSQYLAARRASVFEEERNSSFSSFSGVGRNGGLRKSGFGDRLDVTPTGGGGGGEGDYFSCEWAKTSAKNLETIDETGSKYHGMSSPIDKYMGKRSESSKQSLAAGTFSAPVSGVPKKASPTTASKRKLSDQQHLLGEESSSDEEEFPTGVTIGGQREMSVSSEEEGVPLMVVPHRSGYHSPSGSSSNSEYKSTQV